MATQSELLARRRAAVAARQKDRPAPMQSEAQPDSTPTSVIDPAGDDTVTGYAPTTATVATASPKVNRKIALQMSEMPDLTTEILQEDMRIPMLKLSQSMSAVNQDDSVRQGNWYYTLTKENLGKEVLIVPVGMRKSRSYFVQGEGVRCRSYDMVQGVGDPGIACEGSPEEYYTVPARDRGCPLRLWTEGDKSKGEKSSPPPCGVNYNFPILILDANDPENGRVLRAMLTFRSTGASMAKQIISVKATNDQEWFATTFRLGVNTRQNAKGTFFVPTIEPAGPTPDPVAVKAAAFANSFNPQSVAVTLESTGDDE